MPGLDADFKAFLDATRGPPESKPTTAEEQQRRRDLEETKPRCVPDFSAVQVIAELTSSGPHIDGTTSLFEAGIVSCRSTACFESFTLIMMMTLTVAGH